MPLAEEGWVEGDVPTKVVERYLEPLAGSDVDALILGCTHYPLFRPVIERVGKQLLTPTLSIADSAEATALELADLLEARDMRAAGTGSLEVLVTDLPQHFETIAQRFLGGTIDSVDAIDL